MRTLEIVVILVLFVQVLRLWWQVNRDCTRKDILSGTLFSLLSKRSAGFFPQPLHIAHRWLTEEALVLPIEVGGVRLAVDMAPLLESLLR
jgi:hypothetical protein